MSLTVASDIPKSIVYAPRRQISIKYSSAFDVLLAVTARGNMVLAERIETFCSELDDGCQSIHYASDICEAISFLWEEIGLCSSREYIKFLDRLSTIIKHLSSSDAY
ncbi:hypothetical protein [Jannaschia faecimaris]|nr:hypothetical protein [Jannaschia faecimaris]